MAKKHSTLSCGVFLRSLNQSFRIDLKIRMDEIIKKTRHWSRRVERILMFRWLNTLVAVNRAY